MNPSPIIEVRDTQRTVSVDVPALERFARQALPHCRRLPEAVGESLSALSEIAIVLVSDRRIAALHQQFMSVAGPTDVLTFQHGEIVVSVDTARANAERFGSRVDDELRLYIVHGFLHLLGFDDGTPEEARAMAAAQDLVLRAARTSNDD